MGDDSTTPTAQGASLFAGEGWFDPIEAGSRVNWNDVRKLRPGEAILVFGRHLVHAYIPRAIVPLDGLVRRNRPGVLPVPKAEDIGRHLAAVTAVRRALAKGAGAADAVDSGEETGLRLLLDAYAAQLADDVAPDVAGLHAALSLPPDLPGALPFPPLAEAEGAPRARPHRDAGSRLGGNGRARGGRRGHLRCGAGACPRPRPG